MRTTRLIVPVAVLALMAGCSGDAAETAPSPDHAQAEDRRRKVAVEEEDDGKPDDGTSSPAGDLAACILGEWTVDMTAQASVAQASIEALAPDAQVSAEGRSDVLVDATQLVSTVTDATTTVTLTLGGQELTSVTTINGVSVQDYTLDGDLMTTYGVDTSGLSMDTRTYLDGVETEVPGFSEGFDDAQSRTATTVGTARLVCTADQLRQIPVVGGTEMPELATVLIRR